MKNVGNSSCGRNQGVSKIFSSPMYRAICAVIFAIAQLSCNLLLISSENYRTEEAEVEEAENAINS